MIEVTDNQVVLTVKMTGTEKAAMINELGNIESRWYDKRPALWGLYKALVSLP